MSFLPSFPLVLFMDSYFYSDLVYGSDRWFLDTHLTHYRPAEFGKTVEHPAREVVPLDMMRGFVDDYAELTEDVVWLQGEVHADRKPVRSLLSLSLSFFLFSL